MHSVKMGPSERSGIDISSSPYVPKALQTVDWGQYAGHAWIGSCKQFGKSPRGVNATSFLGWGGVSVTPSRNCIDRGRGV